MPFGRGGGFGGRGWARASRSNGARALLAANPRFTPSLVFDGDHSFAGVRRDLEALEAHVPRGGLVLMHDYLDPRNDDPCDEDMRHARELGEHPLRVRW